MGKSANTRGQEGGELTAPFAKVVKEIGSGMDTELVVRLDKVANNRWPHAMAKPTRTREFLPASPDYIRLKDASREGAGGV